MSVVTEKLTIDERITRLFNVVVSRLANSPYTITMERYYFSTGKEVQLFRSTHEDASINKNGRCVFVGKPKEALTYLQGINDVFAEFETEVKKKVIPNKAQTYFETLGEAFDHACENASLAGYEIKGSVMLEPCGYCETVRYHLDLTFGGHQLEQLLHIIIYRMDCGKYELTHYIN